MDSYMQERHNSIKVSNPVNVMTGVWEGSVLGPIIFLFQRLEVLPVETIVDWTWIEPRFLLCQLLNLPCGHGQESSARQTTNNSRAGNQYWQLFSWLGLPGLSQSQFKCQRTPVLLPSNIPVPLIKLHYWTQITLFMMLISSSSFRATHTLPALTYKSMLQLPSLGPMSSTLIVPKVLVTVSYQALSDFVHCWSNLYLSIYFNNVFFAAGCLY